MCRFLCFPDCTEFEMNWTLNPTELRERQELHRSEQHHRQVWHPPGRAAQTSASGGSRGSPDGARAQPHLTYAGRPADVGGVANLAEAAEGAHGVDALAVRAEARHHLTLVDVCAGREERGEGTGVNVCTVEMAGSEEGRRDWREMAVDTHRTSRALSHCSGNGNVGGGGEQNQLRSGGRQTGEGCAARRTLDCTFCVLSESYYKYIYESYLLEA